MLTAHSRGTMRLCLYIAEQACLSPRLLLSRAWEWALNWGLHSASLCIPVQSDKVCALACCVHADQRRAMRLIMKQ